MQHPLEVHFQGMPRSPALEAIVRGKVDEFVQRRPKPVSCQVTIESLHQHSPGMPHYAVRLDLAVAGHVLPGQRVQHEDAYVALREAFSDARRQVDDVLQRAANHDRFGESRSAVRET